MAAARASLERGWLGPAAGAPAGRGWRALRRLASLRLTLAVLVLLAVGVIWAYRFGSAAGGSATWPLVGPLALLALNLGAAVATHPAFRRHPALLVFHLALLAVVGLVAAGRLTYLKGRVELSSGEVFAGELDGHEAGPLHPWRLDRVRFANEGFTIEYAPGRQRRETFNRVRVWHPDGREEVLVIGDHRPLIVAGYRFYTTFNKGFAPAFVWRPDAGPPVAGTVHLPAYPLNEYRQANTWRPPGSRTEVWVQLRIDGEVLPPDRPARFAPPARYRLVVRVGEMRRELAPGESVRLPDGVLVFQGLRTWMGYQVFYDPTLPWLVAAAVVGAAALGWHYLARFRRHPWREA
ncbi:hypothetical protein [Inmirania thermothiophila]|uniref:Cytochrome c biogenesis protein n=1 Tax=Inmirania thermothiophila TaxID=1750597 RepID=A0A3N1Y249_9GAMM|nr:hypothetical protein [Inmirania thermothiophila]ROR32913.1 cytochrome c biogenesis protein [Inmirania thermothiophila]